MMQMSKNLWNTGKVVTMDSGFSDSKGLLVCGRRSFEQAMAKPNERGWPVLVPGKYIDEYFNKKLIGHCKTLGKALDVVKFLIHFQGEENT